MFYILIVSYFIFIIISITIYLRQQNADKNNKALCLIDGDKNEYDYKQISIFLAFFKLLNFYSLNVA